MNILALTDTVIEEIVNADFDMLKSGRFPDVRLENDGPDWEDPSFWDDRDANLQWWIAGGPVAKD